MKNSNYHSCPYPKTGNAVGLLSTSQIVIMLLARGDGIEFSLSFQTLHSGTYFGQLRFYIDEALDIECSSFVSFQLSSTQSFSLLLCIIESVLPSFSDVIKVIIRRRVLVNKAKFCELANIYA